MQIGQDLKPRLFTSLQQFKVRKMERRLVVNLPKITQGQVTDEIVQKEMLRLGFRTLGKGKQWNDGLMWMIEYENQEEKVRIMDLIKKIEHDNDIKLMVNQQQDKQQINECQSGKINEQKYRNVKQDRQEQKQQKAEQSLQVSKNNDSFQQLSESSEQFEVLGNGSSINQGVSLECEEDEQEIGQFIGQKSIQSNGQQEYHKEQSQCKAQCLKQSIAQGIQQQPQQQQQTRRQTIQQAYSKLASNSHQRQQQELSNNNEQQQRVINEQKQLVNRQSQKYILHLEEALLIEVNNNQYPINICDQQQQQQQGQQQNIQAYIQQEKIQEQQVMQGSEKQGEQKEEKSIQQQQAISFKINVDYQYQQTQVQKETQTLTNCIQSQLQHIPQIEQQSNISQSQQSNMLPVVEQIEDTHNQSTNINNLQIQQQQQKQTGSEEHFTQYTSKIYPNDTDGLTIIQNYCTSDNLLINQQSQPISQLVTIQNQLLSPINKFNQQIIHNINANTNTQNDVNIKHQHQHHHNTGQSSQQSLTLSEQNISITQINDTSHKQPQLIHQTNPQQPKTQKRQPLINKALLQMKNSESIMEIIEDKDESDRLYITETPYPIQTNSYPIQINSYNKSQKKSYRHKNIQKPYKMQNQSSSSFNHFNSQRYAVLGFLTGVLVLMVYLFYL